MKIFSIEFNLGRDGHDDRLWVCRIWFTLRTVNQFTDEQHNLHDSARWKWLAYWRAMRAVRQFARKHYAKIGERESNGWA